MTEASALVPRPKGDPQIDKSQTDRVRNAATLKGIETDDRNDGWRCQEEFVMGEPTSKRIHRRLHRARKRKSWRTERGRGARIRKGTRKLTGRGRELVNDKSNEKDEHNCKD